MASLASFEHDDAAYAADTEVTVPPAPPAPPSLPSPASRRVRSMKKNRVTTLYAGRLRQQPAPSQVDDVVSDVEPFRFSEVEQDGSPIRNGVDDTGSSVYEDATTRTPSKGSSRSSSDKTGRPPFIVSPPRQNKFAFDDSFDDSSDYDHDHDNTADARLSVHEKRAEPGTSTHTSAAGGRVSASHPLSPSSHTLSRSSPASPASSTATGVFDRSVSLNTTVTVSLSSVHTSVASANTSTAPTSPASPTPSHVLATTQPPLSPLSSRFAGFSYHPVLIDAPPPRQPSGLTGVSLPATKESEIVLPAVASTFPFPPPPTSPPAHARTPVSPPASPGAMLVGNFSRPRQASIKQPAAPITTTTQSSQPERSRSETSSPTLDFAGQSVRPSERPRGMSVSSNEPPLHSVTQRPSRDYLRPTRLPSPAPRDAAAESPGLRHPPTVVTHTNVPESVVFNSEKTTGIGAPLLPSFSLPQPPQPLDPENRAKGHEAPSSDRLRDISSAVDRLGITDVRFARNSILTKSSTRGSLAWFTNGGNLDGDEGLSVDDVMGMYEKGFGDSTGTEDEDADETFAGATESRASGVSRGNASTGRNSEPIGSQVLDAMDESLPIPPQMTKGLDNTAPTPPRPASAQDVNDAVDAVDTNRRRRRSSSVPTDSSFGLASRRMVDMLSPVPAGEEQDDSREKHDSGKMLGPDDEKSVAPSSPALSRHLDASVAGSRPASTSAPSLFAQSAQDRDADPSLRDRYGFRKQNQYVTREQYDRWNGPYTEYLGRRRRKWVSYLRDSGLMTENPTRFPPPCVKTKRFIRKGIPPEWRGAAWFYYAGGPSIVAKHPGIYDKLIARAVRGDANGVDVESIERDLHRTFPDNVKFQFTGSSQPGHNDADYADSADGALKKTVDVTASRPDEPRIVSKLRRVLLAFSIYNPRIGYCQSLNFIAGMLLLFVQTEEQCFWLLNVITRIFLPGTHETSLEGSKVDLGVLMAAMQESLPGVWAKIGGDLEDPAAAAGMARHGTVGRRMKLPKIGGTTSSKMAALSVPSSDRLPPITLCMTAWFMSCFIGTLPVETTLRVWDVFFYEGSKTLFRVALAIFKLGESEIRAVTDPMEMFGVVQGLPRRMLDSNMLIETTFRRRNGFGHISQETIEEKRRERRAEFKEARRAQPLISPLRSPATPSATTSGHAEAIEAESAASSGGSMLRKGTLFGRRRDRRPGGEVM